MEGHGKRLWENSLTGTQAGMNHGILARLQSSFFILQIQSAHAWHCSDACNENMCTCLVSQHRVPHTVLRVHRGQQLLGRDPPAPSAVGLGGAERDRPFPGNRRRRYPRSLQGFGEHSFHKRLPHPSIHQSHKGGGGAAAEQIFK